MAKDIGLLLIRNGPIRPGTCPLCGRPDARPDSDGGESAVTGSGRNDHRSSTVAVDRFSVGPPPATAAARGAAEVAGIGRKLPSEICQARPPLPLSLKFHAAYPPDEVAGRHCVRPAYRGTPFRPFRALSKFGCTPRFRPDFTVKATVARYFRLHGSAPPGSGQRDALGRWWAGDSACEFFVKWAGPASTPVSRGADRAGTKLSGGLAVAARTEALVALLLRYRSAEALGEVVAG